MVGCLEYDPEIPVRQRHRDYLERSVVFKEVVPISDPVIRNKIHQTYRLGYLKVQPSHNSSKKAWSLSRLDVTLSVTTCSTGQSLRHCVSPWC